MTTSNLSSPRPATELERPDSCKAGSPLFLLGVHRRCGSNFVADALRLWPEFQMPEPIAEDYLLEYSPRLLEYVEKTAEEQYRKRFQEPERYEECKARLLGAMGESLLKFLANYVEPGRRLLTKTPDPWNLHNFFLLFPEATLVLLVRDGRDIVESSHRSWPDEPYAMWMNAWAKGAREMLDFIRGPGVAWAGRWKLVRYEDLVSDRAAMEDLLRFAGVEPAAYAWDAFDALPLRGSSTERGGRHDLHWDPVKRPKDFKPVGRWQSWNWWRKRQFKRLAGRELIELGYVENNDW